MKKIILIPATLVAAATPIIATTSCNKQNEINIKMTEVWTDGGGSDARRLYTKNSYNFVTGEKYFVDIDMKDFDFSIEYYEYCFTIAKEPTSIEPQMCPIISPLGIWVDNQRLMLVPKGSEGTNIFWMEIEGVPPNTTFTFRINDNLIKENSIVRIGFEVYDSLNDYYPIFVIGNF